MSVERLNDVEKDLAVLKSIVPSLMEKMDTSTKAQIELTSEIKALVKSNGEASSTMRNHSRRIIALEQSEAIRKSGDDVKTWIIRAVVVGLTTAVLSLVLIK